MFHIGCVIHGIRIMKNYFTNKPLMEILSPCSQPQFEMSSTILFCQLNNLFKIWYHLTLQT